jgi:AraC-like DNA-binding protein
VLNLISNATKFTTKGEVSLIVEPGPESVTIRVRDSGLGIPREEQEAIFDEFRRSERSIGRGYGGLGLGLAICRRLVELHGGTIGVRSTGQEGAGSTFYFTLPTVPPPARLPAQRPAAVRDGNQGVLVLTNRPGTGERLCDYLNRRGFEVHMALMDEAPEWQSLLVASPPSVVVLDMSVASDQGWNALRVIKANPATQGIPVLLYALSQDSGAVLELDYLTKPIELAELTRALDQQWLAADPSQPTCTILVVDDDPNTLEVHARIVQRHSSSNRVLKARSGREALDALRQSTVDLVLLDLMMPEMDGFAVLEAMREHEATRDIPVIVVTGQVLLEADMARLNRGVAKVLGKGLFGLDETLAHLGTVLACKRELSVEAQRLVRQTMAYIHEHYAEPISRTDLARHVAFSDDYLTSCFRRELGLTPIAYLTRYRVSQAKQLLRETDKNVTEIALEVGFSDSSYFSRVFRREVGVSPQAYRQV